MRGDVIFRAGVYGIIARDDLLLVVRKTRGPHRGRWDLPGGGMEFGETPAETLCREVQEETGIVPLSWSLFDNFTSAGEYNVYNSMVPFHQVGMLYEVTEYDDSQWNSMINEEDVDGSVWVPVTEDIPLTPFAKRVFQQRRSDLKEESPV